jgi:hypothetical protein
MSSRPLIKKPTPPKLFRISTCRHCGHGVYNTAYDLSQHELQYNENTSAKGYGDFFVHDLCREQFAIVRELVDKELILSSVKIEELQNRLIEIRNLIGNFRGF